MPRSRAVWLICGWIIASLALLPAVSTAPVAAQGVTYFHGGWGGPFYPPYPPRVFQYGYTTPYGAFSSGWSYGVPGGYPYGYYPPPGYYAPGPSWGGAYYTAPLVLPAETLYGPQAVQRFMGIDSNPVATPPLASAPVIATPAPQLGGFGVLAPNNAPVVANRPRASTDAAKARALALLQRGDDDFRAQRFAQALQRYKDAAVQAPDVAEVYFRQGWALAAIGQFEFAARSVLRAVELKPELAKSGFRVGDLYGENQITRTAHLQAIEAARQQRPIDPAPVLLLGLYQLYDGQFDAARPLLTKAKELSLGDTTPVQAFLDALPPIPAPMPRN